jgi:hypothetical protein
MPTRRKTAATKGGRPQHVCKNCGVAFPTGVAFEQHKCVTDLADLPLDELKRRALGDPSTATLLARVEAMPPSGDLTAAQRRTLADLGNCIAGMGMSSNIYPRQTIEALRRRGLVEDIGPIRSMLAHSRDYVARITPAGREALKQPRRKIQNRR